MKNQKTGFETTSLNTLKATAREHRTPENLNEVTDWIASMPPVQEIYCSQVFMQTWNFFNAERTYLESDRSRSFSEIVDAINKCEI